MSPVQTAQRLWRPADTTVGTRLSPLEIPITATLVAAGAIATRDFQKVHHDRDVAVAAGAKDIFMNILTTNALVNRYVGAWAGPRAVVTGIDIRLGATNFPGDTMVLTGEVTASDGEEIVVGVVGTNEFGAHVTGTVSLRLAPVGQEEDA